MSVVKLRNRCTDQRWITKVTGRYRTKSVILEMYDQMKAAMESGGEYQTWLDPPPADERVAHSTE